MTISIFSVILFCGCCYFLAKSILTPVSRLQNPGYTYLALRVRKTYKVFSFSILSIFFLATLIQSFLEIFSY